MSLADTEKGVEFIQDDYKIYGYRGLTYADVEGYNIESSEYESFSYLAKSLLDAIEFVISSITRSSTGSDKDRNVSSTAELPTELEELFEDTRGYCMQYTGLTAQIQEYRQRRYNVYLNTLNIHESQSVKLLTALAAGFLPLSLGASLLSMQTRFAKLGYLIYDFVGVGVLLFFLMGLVWLVAKLLVRTTNWRPFGPISAESLDLENTDFTPDVVDHLYRLKKRLRGRTILNWMWKFFTSVLVLCILASFLVGMFQRVSLGLKLLGYSVAAIFGLLFMTVVFMLAVWAVARILGYQSSTNGSVENENSS